MDGQRLDLLSSTQHDRFARFDYAELKKLGIRTIRTGARWHLIENSPGIYKFDSLDVLLNAAADCEMEVILDLLHFGWPDHTQIFSETFPERFAQFTRATVKYLKEREDGCRFIAPVNEISFFAWAGGEVAAINPYYVNRGDQLKRQLVRAAIASSDILLNGLQNVRLIAPEPVIHIVGNPDVPNDEIEAAAYTQAMFQAWDMLSGRLDPELGGRLEYLDIVGINFYPRNQWIHNTMVSLSRDDTRYRNFSEILEEVWARYRRPLFVSETGTEDDGRAQWFDYICQQVDIARSRQVPVQGICLYPILNHPGWADSRHCHNGLYDYPAASGYRKIHMPLADVICRQQRKLKELDSKMLKKQKDIVCLSHLRWNFVFQRPQHLMKRFAQNGRVFFWEEAVYEGTQFYLRSSICSGSGVNLRTPVLPHGMSHQQALTCQADMLENFLQEEHLTDYLAWYYTPMALEFTGGLQPALTIYDCMDELSAFAGAPAEMIRNEQGLFEKADLVFTGGASLFESKQHKHRSVHLFPSSIDIEHFLQARFIESDPPDQFSIPHPRLGYSGVIDERMNLNLIRELAEMRPHWHLMMLGPVIKIESDSLPKANNIHYLGLKQYPELPAYLSGWDIAMLPFALNESTRFISPTKTPEYLAAGLPVVSSPIQDVIHTYGELGFVKIADGVQEFISAIERLLSESLSDEYFQRVDEFLSRSSWNRTWSEMNKLIEDHLSRSKLDSSSSQNESSKFAAKSIRGTVYV